MQKFVARFVNDESGATAIEYGLIAALIAVGIITAAQLLGTQIATTFNEAHVGLNTASLVALGLVLLVITLAMNILARLLVRQTVAAGGTR